MLTTVLEVEEPLLQAMLRQIDEVLEKGLHHLTWRSHAINDFIREVTVLVKEAGDTLATLKANMAAAEAILHGWSEQPMLRRKLAKTCAQHCALSLASYNLPFKMLRPCFCPVGFLPHEGSARLGRL